MKYLCLAYYDVQKFEDLSEAELHAIVDRCPQHDVALRASGRLVATGSLELPRQAVSIRPGGGKSLITDGPFTETKEQVGGFFIVEAADRDEAVRIASLHPAAHLGERVGWGVEVRAFEMFEQP
jgi:hypothetical protein